MSRRRAGNIISGPNYDRLPTTNGRGGIAGGGSSIRRVVVLGILALLGIWLFLNTVTSRTFSNSTPAGDEVEDDAALPSPAAPVNKPAHNAPTPAPAASPASPVEKAMVGPKPAVPAEHATNFSSPPPCSTPAPNRPLIQHALMIDAGSTGSRIHVFKFHYCDGPTPTLLGEIFHQLKPGLSYYKEDAVGAAKSLDPLLQKAVEAVPKQAWPCTPIAVKATAGLRLLGKTESEAILAAVRSRLESEYGFRVVENEGVSIMDGADEGVFAWITTNYLLGRLSAPNDPTAAIMDLGGGSTQIVFEPLVKDPPLAKGDHRFELTFNNHLHVLYQHSYLKYGLMEARKSLLAAAARYELIPTHPCLPRGEVMNGTHPVSNKTVLVTGTGAGFPSCSQFVAANLFNKSGCALEPCSWDGVHQPRLRSVFPEEMGGEIYAFSYFFDRTVDVGFFDDDLAFTIDDLGELGDWACRGDEGHKPEDKWKEGTWAEVVEAVKNEPAFCMDVAFMYHLLGTGYEISKGRELKTAKKIGGIEAGWCLGASIHMVDALMTADKEKGWKGICKAEVAE
ncbi:Guanosine-diphosphatase [Irineochytrium annulatum]|nr:Guanosine-diphosphatase [Irineochytrium annulatum]